MEWGWQGGLCQIPKCSVTVHRSQPWSRSPDARASAGGGHCPGQAGPQGRCSGCGSPPGWERGASPSLKPAGGGKEDLVTRGPHSLRLSKGNDLGLGGWRRSRPLGIRKETGGAPGRALGRAQDGLRTPVRIPAPRVSGAPPAPLGSLGFQRGRSREGPRAPGQLRPSPTPRTAAPPRSDPGTRLQPQGNAGGSGPHTSAPAVPLSSPSGTRRELCCSTALPWALRLIPTLGTREALSAPRLRKSPKCRTRALAPGGASPTPSPPAGPPPAHRGAHSSPKATAWVPSTHQRQQVPGAPGREHPTRSRRPRTSRASCRGTPWNSVYLGLLGRLSAALAAGDGNVQKLRSELRAN